MCSVYANGGSILALYISVFTSLHQDEVSFTISYKSIAVLPELHSVQSNNTAAYLVLVLELILE